MSVLSLSLGLVGAPVLASPSEPAETDDAEALIDAAEIATDEGRHRDAAQDYARAYRTLPLALRTGPVGSQLIGRAVESFKLVAQDEGPEALEGLVSLLERHLDDLRTQGKTEELDELEETLERIRREVEESRESEGPTDEVLEDDETTSRASAVELKATTDPGKPVDDPEHRSGRSLGIGLVAGGSAFILGGAGMLAAGPSMVVVAQRRLDERGGEQEGDDEYLDDARTVRNALLISGGVAAALGVTAVVIGALRLKRGQRRSDVALGVLPSRHGSGIVVSGRF